jgi:hypothetical protein
MIATCIPREEPVAVLNLDRINDLPVILQENSGMTQAGDLIWFINDGGNEPALYGYSAEQDSVMRIVTVQDAVNTDWEEITQNEEYLFIGDFGNNAGDRTDLRIYRIDKNDLFSGADTVVPSGIIAFSYSDQTSFTPAVENTPFDCEAFIATDDSLLLFTKDWQSFNTRIYALSTAPGTQIAKYQEQWEFSGLVTASAWDSEIQQLWLLGYTPFIPVIYVYNGFSETDLTFDESRRTSFQDFWGIQTEGIMISNGTVYVSAEGALNNPAALFQVVLE